MRIPRIVTGMLWAGFMVLGADVVCGQAYPNKPVRILTNEVGGGNDFVARILVQGFSESLGQPVIIENRPGLYSTEIVAHAQPDGYTLLCQGQSMWLSAYMRKVAWKFSDFSPVTILNQGPNILVVNPALPANSVKELIALAKSKPGVLNYSAGTRGSAVHLAAELFNLMAGVNIVGIPYKGGSLATNAVIAGEAQVSFPTATGVTPFIKSGKLRALAVTSAQPSALAPGLPTVAASGLPGYEMVNSIAMLTPAKTPAGVIRRLNQEILRVLNRPDVKEKLASAGTDVVGNSPEQAAAMIKAEMARLGKLITDAGIRAE